MGLIIGSRMTVAQQRSEKPAVGHRETIQTVHDDNSPKKCRMYVQTAPIQVPETNGIAERFVQTARSECLDWLLIVSAQHLQHTLTVFIDHYNDWRPHRSLDLAPPNGRPSAATWVGAQPIAVTRRDRLGGLIHEYERAA
jgi:transposase InsO family protein